jgi:hypothetical protein
MAPASAEWYSDFTLAGSANVGPRLSLARDYIAGGGEMRVTVRFRMPGQRRDNHLS